MTSPEDRIQQLLMEPKKSVLTLHRRPDGDSLGSNLALKRVLEANGHTVDLYSIDKVPEYLSFLPGSDQVKVLSPTEIRWLDYDVYWALDMGAADMVGEDVTFPPQQERIVIDHHRTNVGWGSVNLIEAKRISTASVLYSLFERGSHKLDAETGLCLLTGLATDSGFFNYIEDADPLRTAADLIEKTGADYQTIIFNIMRNTNVEDVLFLGNALQHIKVDYEKKVAMIAISNATWMSFGSDGANSNMVMGYLQSIIGTEIGVLLIEDKPGLFRIRFRSRNRAYDVAELAAKFGGGGHKNAAGAKLEADSLDEAIKKVTDAV